MEITRKIVNFIFWIIIIAGLGYLTVMLLGGGFPISIDPSVQKVKFDIAFMGWEANDPANGTLKIVYDKGYVKEGWGSLRYTYKVGKSKLPGFHTNAYLIEGIGRFKFFMRAKEPGVWQLQIKRKTDSKLFTKTFHVGKKWAEYEFPIYTLKQEINYTEKFDNLDFQQWLNFVDITKRGYKENTVWIDGLVIYR